MTENVRLRVQERLRLRMQILPSLLPTQIELRNTGTEIQWRYIDGVSDWETLILVLDLLPEAADILAKLLTVDGDGSGLDADLLDGQHASAFQTNAKTFQIVTASGTTAVADATDEVIVKLGSVDVVTLQLGTAAARDGRRLKITQWNLNATITVAADGGDADGIKGASTIDLVAGTTVEFDPVTGTLNGWSF